MWADEAARAIAINGLSDGQGHDNGARPSANKRRQRFVTKKCINFLQVYQLNARRLPALPARSTERVTEPAYL